MTTVANLISYYVKTLIIQYTSLPKAEATIATVVEPVIMPQQNPSLEPLPLAVQDAFNLVGDNLAQGVQLDTLGKYVGVTRTGAGFTGVITLNDADFRALTLMATATNNAGSSLADIQKILHAFFPGEMFITDYADMRIAYMISSGVGSQELVQLFISEGLLPKPMGVQIQAIIYVVLVDTLFSFSTYNHLALPPLSPFNTYGSYHTNYPWLSYAAAITF